MTWSERILGFPVRAAAVDDFLRELKAKGTGDLNAVLTTLNEGGLCRQAVDHWVGQGWIVPAPNSPLIALRGPAFGRELTLHDFCGDFEEAAVPDGTETIAVDEEESETHGDS
jgi:hypothetical protein